MLHPELPAEVARRRTFAIISHPDAGKTTLTEKLLLYGGAIRQAGSVKARKAARHATSDWMEIEKQRGISVTSSAMQFDFDGFRINILDTPGHQDFSEDTYRTLVAADSAVMLIDNAKGVEEQTIKLFKVCRMRSIPIFTFVNKLDRAGRDPFELMEELENVLGIRSCPVNWPIGIHGDFQGVYHRDTRVVELYRGGDHGQKQVEVETIALDDPHLPEAIGQSYYDKLLEDVELLDVAGDPFDLDMILEGKLTPMFFGSASNNFGVEPFLKRFLSYTKSPTPRVSDHGVIEPTDEKFTGFIFKIQANMNPAHRDRLAFMRVCSGVFEKGMTVWHSSSGEKVKLAQPQQFMAQEHETVETAYPGDIIGLFDPGIFRLGDTLVHRRARALSGHPPVRAGVLLPRQPRGFDEAQAVFEGRLPAFAGGRHPDLQAPQHRPRGDDRRRGGRVADGRAGIPLKERVRREHTARKPALPLRALDRSDPEAAGQIAADLHHRARHRPRRARRTDV